LRALRRGAPARPCVRPRPRGSGDRPAGRPHPGERRVRRVGAGRLPAPWRTLMRLRRRGFLSMLSALGGAAAVGRPARGDEVPDGLAGITKVRAGVQTLVGAFVQERTIGLLATTVKSEGEMTLVRPDRLRWELRPPDAITYWIGPEGLAYATPTGGGSVGKSAAGRFRAVLGDLRTLLGGAIATLRPPYD